MQKTIVEVTLWCFENFGLPQESGVRDKKILPKIGGTKVGRLKRKEHLTQKQAKYARVGATLKAQYTLRGSLLISFGLLDKTP